MRVVLVNPLGVVENVIEADSVESISTIFPDMTPIPHARAGSGWRLIHGELVELESEPTPTLWEVLPTYQFYALFTPNEWRGYKRAREADATIDHLLLILEAAPTVHRTHPLVQQGLSAGVTLGILTPERARAIGG